MMEKDTDIRARISTKLKEKFMKKLEEDGITQSDFIVSCILNYLGIKTESIKKKNTFKMK